MFSLVLVSTCESRLARQAQPPRPASDRSFSTPSRLNLVEALNIYGHRVRQSMDKPGKVANSARGQLNTDFFFPPISVRA